MLFCSKCATFVFFVHFVTIYDLKNVGKYSSSTFPHISNIPKIKQHPFRFKKIVVFLKKSHSEFCLFISIISQNLLPNQNFFSFKCKSIFTNPLWRNSFCNEICFILLFFNLSKCCFNCIFNR